MDRSMSKLDPKGRITLPLHIRKQLGLTQGSELFVVSNEGHDIRIFPLEEGKMAYLHAIIPDNPGSLSKVVGLVAENNIDLIATSSVTRERGKTAEWTALADISRCSNLKIDKDAVRSLEIKLV